MIKNKILDIKIIFKNILKKFQVFKLTLCGVCFFT